MGNRRIIWSKIALRDNVRIACWYRDRLGNMAFEHYNKGILGTVRTLVQMPTIGRVDIRFSKDKTIYYSFLAHPKYRIVYRYTQRTLYIVAIRSTMMK